jgi:hypothetical protein
MGQAPGAGLVVTAPPGRWPHHGPAPGKTRKRESAPHTPRPPTPPQVTGVGGRGCGADVGRPLALDADRGGRVERS